MIFDNDISETNFLFKANEVSVYMKREDLLHKHISGNKFRKLKYNILEALYLQKNTILTFGGAYSNHIAATAYVGKMFNINTIGVIRGDELGEDLADTLKRNTTLKLASEYGMQFKFISRKKYREKATTTFLKELEQEFGGFYLVPEGGTNALAIKGCEEILKKEDEKFDYICVAVGTGGTISGIINASNTNQKVLGFPALKGDFLKEAINKNGINKNNWQLINHYHFGGYAKINTALVRYINQFKEQHKIQLDPIYTAKMMFGIEDLIQQNYFKKGTSILAIHTGGLQGIDVMNARIVKKGYTQIIQN